MGGGGGKAGEVSRALQELMAPRAESWSGSNVGSEARGHCHDCEHTPPHSIPTSRRKRGEQERKDGGEKRASLLQWSACGAQARAGPQAGAHQR